MPIMKTNQDQLWRYFFWSFLFLHVICWTLGSYLTRPSLPHDTLESITWGLQWQLGYYKHPSLTAWLCAGVFQLSHGADWSIYLLAQLLVVTTFIAMWRLAKQLYSPAQAFLASLLLEGILFYNINSFNLTPDTLQSPLWALTILFFYHALIKQELTDWLLTACFAALSFWTKYQIVFLLIPMLLLCLIDSQAKISLKKPAFYSALCLFFLLISPHLIWLYQHDFISLDYAFNASEEYTKPFAVLGHLYYPLLFLANQLFHCTGAFILLWPFYKIRSQTALLTAFQWRFILILGFGPLVLTLLSGLICGTYFPPRWATPYFSLFGIILIGCFKPQLTRKSTILFFISFIVFSSLLFSIRMAHLVFMPRAHNDAFLPHQSMARSLNQLWHTYYKAPLPYLAGSNYLVALLTPYMPDKPHPYLSWSNKDNPWLDEALLRQKGALFVWDEGENYAWDKNGRTFAHLTALITGRFPELITLPQQTFYRLHYGLPIVIGVALLPPYHEQQINYQPTLSDSRK
ncbi:MAG: hypothetical protein CK426_01180 [Legionella sp.]|nr:MAG: hypothetical protein CK423_04795 [Legionella sp.]PJD99844.1 MAG: hypothetical protein CK426_01180 [Legionella sp.]